MAAWYRCVALAWRGVAWLEYCNANLFLRVKWRLLVREEGRRVAAFIPTLSYVEAAAAAAAVVITGRGKRRR
ncbi:hypothetical protein IWX90DRAFT_261974 [Phyllosticta citrichinensis]|uniref:Secreted protein n=1 Tax=Phyllosticta citrichinensis TaxID=1130410 RepID=A0ABR1XSE7_9PEZI